MKVVASSETTLSSTNDIFVGPNPPPHPVVGQLWLDTSVKPPVLRMWDGEQWIVQEMDVENLDPDFVEKMRDENQTAYQEAMDFANALSERMKNEASRLDGLFTNVEALSTKANENSSQISTIKQSYFGLESKVSNLETNTSSSITQLSDQINQRVMKGDLITQINLEAGSAYISSKAIVLDGDTTVRGTFYAPKVLSGSTVAGNAYTLIEGAYLKSRGYFSKTWLENTRAGWHEVTIDKGHVKMKDTTNGGAVYYTARGISTQMDGDNDGQASGTIEFMSRKYLNSVNGLTISSSGRLALESTAGSRIYINPRGAGVHIADENDTYYDLYANNIFAARTLFINGWEAATKDYVNTRGFLSGSALSSGYTIGSWIIGSSNLNSASGNIKMGNDTGNIVCNNLTQTSQRELKKNIKPWTGDGYGIVKSVPVRQFQYTDELDEEFPHVGFILDEVSPWMADIEGYGVSVNQTVNIVWNALQTAIEKIERLEGMVK
ncbi:tail fiber domain-containing protein [Rummeliibacillus stabekisii]|uniref:tail fiber domain-containing protein n=1 Tax=Rummeliibacillus stabekisii TaxID=241244 RepID=UPI00371F3CF5